MDMHYINNGKFDLYISDSSIPDAGLGVFSNEYINPDIIIGEYRF